MADLFPEEEWLMILEIICQNPGPQHLSMSIPPLPWKRHLPSGGSFGHKCNQKASGMAAGLQSQQSAADDGLARRCAFVSEVNQGRQDWELVSGCFSMRIPSTGTVPWNARVGPALLQSCWSASHFHLDKWIPPPPLWAASIGSLECDCRKVEWDKGNLRVLSEVFRCCSSEHATLVWGAHLNPGFCRVQPS